MASDTSNAHKGDLGLWAHKYPDGVTDYELRAGHSHCSYCGSMHPREVANLLRAGGKLDPADRKYGWPHKFYLSNHQWGKFYTRHIVDAKPEDRDVIERAMGLHIDFDPERQSVGWRPYGASPLTTTEEPTK